MYIHPLTLAPPFYPTSHSTPLGHHRAPSWAPRTMQQLPTSCFTHSSVYVCLITQSRPTLCDPMDCSPAGSSVHGDSPGKNTGVGCHALLQGIFPTQGWDPGPLHCRRSLYQLSPQGSLGVYICQCCSFSSFHPPLPALCPFSTSVPLFLPCT